MGTFLAVGAAVLVVALIERINAMRDAAQEEHWARKYRGRR